THQIRHKGADNALLPGASNRLNARSHSRIALLVVVLAHYWRGYLDSWDIAHVVLHLAAGFSGAAYNRDRVSLFHIQANSWPGNTYYAGIVYPGAIHAAVYSPISARFWLWLALEEQPKKPGGTHPP